jgi:hypothetical protein
MNQSHFRLTYDGPALAAHTMDVRELAPALLAVGDLLEAATRALNGDRVKPQINVRASFQAGSFGIDFSLAVDWALRIRDVFASEDSSAMANALAILSAIGFLAKPGKKGLIGVLRWIRGRQIEKIEAFDGSARIHVEKELLEVDLAVIALLRDLAVREALDSILVPLDRDGVDTFACGTDSDFSEILHKEDRPWFRPPSIEDDLILDDVRKMAFSIVSLAFKDDNKWRLYDGAATIHATISDPSFLARVDQNVERFAKGDLLICQVRVRQWQTASGARTEYEVMEVLEHRQAARQIRLPI